MSESRDYLTRRQKEILVFIEDFRQQEGVSPTHREICDHFGYSSYGTVYKHLKLLEQKGYLWRDWNQKRGIQLLRKAPGRDRENRTKEAAAGASAASGGGGLRELPFLGRIAAGRPIMAVEGNDSLPVPEHLLGRTREKHFVLKVVGDSMIDEGIHDGDFVVVQRREKAESGEMVVALVGDEATLKRFFPEGDQIRLQPANPNMQPFMVPAADVMVQGIVVGLMRKF
jgi:repressor LexA